MCTFYLHKSVYFYFVLQVCTWSVLLRFIFLRITEIIIPLFILFCYQKLDGSPYLSKLGELRVNLHSQLPSSLDDSMMNSLVNNFRQKSTMIEKLAAQSPGFDSSISSTLSLASRKTLEQTTPSYENNTQVFSIQELGLSRSCDAYLSTSSSPTTASVTRSSHTLQLITTSTSSSSTAGSVTRTLQTGSFTHIKQLITASSASSVAVLGKRKSTDVNPSVSSPVVGSKSGTRPMFRTREVNPTPVVSELPEAFFVNSHSKEIYQIAVRFKSTV